MSELEEAQKLAEDMRRQRNKANGQKRRIVGELRKQVLALSTKEKKECE